VHNTTIMRAISLRVVYLGASLSTIPFMILFINWAFCESIYSNSHRVQFLAHRNQPCTR
jgi:hypothetical protein